MGDNERVVTGAESATEGSEPISRPDGQDDHSGGGEGRENHIPISRAEEMWARREAKMRKEWEEKELSPLRSRFEEEQKRITNAELARLKAMGWLQDEPPKPITAEQFEKTLNERLEKARAEERQERLQEYYSMRINDGWREVSRKYPELAKAKSFQNSVLAMYAENPQADFVNLADTVAKEFDAYVTTREAAAQKEREDRRKPANRVVPGGRGAGGGSNEGKKEKGTVAERVLAKLRESRGE